MAVQTIPASLARERRIERVMNNQTFKLVRYFKVIFSLIFLMCVSACKPDAPESYTVGITGYNFTTEGVQYFYVNEQWGSNISPYGGGGGTTCCIILPAKWRPGLVVKIDWKIGHYNLPWSKLDLIPIDEISACCWVARTLSKTVPVEPYSDVGGNFQVFFLPNDEVKVWVHTGGPDSPNHPSGMSYPKDPNADKKE